MLALVLVPALVLAPTFTPLECGGEGGGVGELGGELLLARGWLAAGELLVFDFFGLFAFFRLFDFSGLLDLDFDFLCFFGTTTLLGGGMMIAESSAAEELAAVFLPSLIFPNFCPMKVTEEDLCKKSEKLVTGHWQTTGNFLPGKQIPFPSHPSWTSWAMVPMAWKLAVSSFRSGPVALHLLRSRRQLPQSWQMGGCCCLLWPRMCPRPCRSCHRASLPLKCDGWSPPLWPESTK